MYTPLIKTKIKLYFTDFSCKFYYLHIYPIQLMCFMFPITKFNEILFSQFQLFRTILPSFSLIFSVIFFFTCTVLKFLTSSYLACFFDSHKTLYCFSTQISLVLRLPQKSQQTFVKFLRLR